ncbi:HEPN domain-containing protein [Serratia sp. B1]|nr:HEPN domain-containing protein [Serratia sp. B1]
MSTFIADYLDTVDLQWKEIDILASQATKVENSNFDLYNALCRSITILIVAHMEGFVKGVVKSIINDYSTVKFKDLPQSLKITYCKKHLGFDESAINGYHERVKNLISDFELSSDFKINYEPFIFEKNRNPKPDAIGNIAARFGVRDLFKNLHDSRFDNVFSMTSTEIRKSLPYLNDVTKRKVSTFPYCVRKNIYKTKPKKYTGRSLWETFLDDLNQKRHTIVHGNDFNNSTNVKSLLELKDKVRVLQFCFILILCSELCNS